MTPAFDPTVTAYTTSTTNNSNTITAAGATGSTVTITVNGKAHTNGAAATWQSGENTVIVKAQDSSGTKTYTVTVTKTGV